MHKKRYAILTLCLIFSTSATPVWACGWWGDAEGADDQKTVSVDKDGKPIPESEIGAAALAEMKIPKQMGYGVAVYLADKAIPYLRAVKDPQINSIQDLKKKGFVTVIDIGSSSKASGFHSQESQDLGMHYMHVPVDQNGYATPDGIKKLHQAIQNYKLRPMLIYAPKADVLATAWGQHRQQQGRRWNVVESDVKHLGISVAALHKLKNQKQ